MPPTPEVQSIPEALLEVVEPDGRRRTVPLTRSPFLIGRGTEVGNDLPLADKRISRRAAAVTYAQGEFCVEDRGQRRGVFVNGEKVEEARPLRPGDLISFGASESTQLIFRRGPQRQSLPQLLSRLEQAGGLEPGTRDLRPLSLLLEATALLQSHLPLEEALAAMVDRAVTLTSADRGLLLEFEPTKGLRPLVARLAGGRAVPPESIPASQTALTQAVQKRHSVVEEDLAQASSSLGKATSVIEQKLRSVVAIPLQSLAPLRATDQTYVSTPGELLGVLYLDSRRPAAFSRVERQILNALAQEAASVLDNARLVKKEQERQRLERELDIARGIQRALLPRSFQAPPHVEITGVNRSCLAVGGDYFDLMAPNPKQTAFVIADVCGKGLGAALLTAMLQGTFSAMTLGEKPARIFDHANQFIWAHSDVERFATLFFGLLDTSGRLTFINAGHPPPLLVHRGQAEFMFAADSLPVGLLPEAKYQASSHDLEPGDTLVLFTDGITEAENPQMEQFGMERLKELVARHASAPVEELQAAILAGVEEFTRGAYQADDITLLIVRYRGAG